MDMLEEIGEKEHTIDGLKEIVSSLESKLEKIRDNFKTVVRTQTEMSVHILNQFKE